MHFISVESSTLTHHREGLSGGRGEHIGQGVRERIGRGAIDVEACCDSYGGIPRPLALTVVRAHHSDGSQPVAVMGCIRLNDGPLLAAC